VFGDLLFRASLTGFGPSCLSSHFAQLIALSNELAEAAVDRRQVLLRIESQRSQNGGIKGLAIRLPDFIKDNQGFTSKQWPKGLQDSVAC
jgi:hypothetical protein